MIGLKLSKMLKEIKIENKEKYYIKTFGCQMNEFDSERISYILENEGYEKTADIEKAKIIVINTCSVRERADNRLYGHIGNLKALKAKKPEIIICIGGCTAQNLKDKIFDDFPYVDIVFGTGIANNLPELIKKIKLARKSLCEVSLNNSHNNIYNFKRTYKFKAFIPVTVGCNNFCSYCIVPYVRGRERSVSSKDIIKTINDLVLDGVIEVMLLGQNVNSYGNDLKDSLSFAELLEEISKIHGLERIRFMTSHPKDFSENIVRVIKNHKNIVKHVHLPLQAGSNKVLRLMNRKYSREDFINLVNMIKKEIPDCSITTDIIVGFPGEDYKNFNSTLEIVKKLKFNRAFTFIYSKRNGTKAFEMLDSVPVEEKKKWFKELLDTQNNISYEENSKLVGKKFKVLVEGLSTKKGLKLEGRLENNTIVNFDGKADLIGKLIWVDITDAKSFYLSGNISKKIIK
jgi:tRNA-2-methylthio-N6-dimethylallyladenosine synthase